MTAEETANGIVPNENLLQALRDLCSVRTYQDKDIPNETLLEILESARWAPSPLDTQPWEFVIVRDRAMLAKLREIGHFAGFLEKAPVAIVVLVKPIFEKWSMSLAEHEHAASIAVENIRLAAWERGIGSCWVSVEHEAATRLVGAPAEYSVISVVSMGYPAGVIKHTNTRNELMTMVHYEKYGNSQP